MGLSRKEQEVIISWNAADKTVSIYDYRDATTDTLEAAGYGSGKEHRLKGDMGAWETVARSWTGIPLATIRLHANGKIVVKERKARGRVGEPSAEPAPPYFANRQRKNGKTGLVALPVETVTE